MYRLLLAVLGLANFPYIRTCCSPDVLQGTAMYYGYIVKEQKPYQNMIKFYYDADEKKIAMITNTMGNMTDQVRDIYDYSARKRYVITNNNTCNVTELENPFEKICVPSSANFMGSTNLGNSKANMSVDMYRMNVKKGKMSGQADIMVTPMEGGECTLVGVVMNGEKNGDFQMTETSIYMNFTFEIPDKSVFEPPKQCFKHNKMESILFEVLGGIRREIFIW
ncbi:uncharacterized protein LOC133172654 [Saccostrea echinata]|uniref:uncharacterized protein LOC133172654 n=1 Tax=Saccostrea echinata TaxID=191078 RepID=UPI002A807C55|nr:uncharacterized protein LOC133172654 [Saccostrea echinata]